jgi:hypothetical protein
LIGKCTGIKNNQIKLYYAAGGMKADDTDIPLLYLIKGYNYFGSVRCIEDGSFRGKNPVS